MNKPILIIYLILFAAFSMPPTSWADDEKKVEMKLNDQMKYDVTNIDAAPGERVIITLTNGGELPKNAMAHNFVLLKAGTDVAAFATAGMSHPADAYIPPDMKDKVIIASKLLGPGESDTISFTAPAAGTYDYICTFPGHALAGMRGTLTVK